MAVYCKCAACRNAILVTLAKRIGDKYVCLSCWGMLQADNMPEVNLNEMDLEVSK